MSGGHWESDPFLIQQGLENIGEDEYTKKYFPQLAKVFVELANVLHEILDALDYDVSCDQLLRDKKAYQEYAIKLLSKAIKGENDDDR